MSAWVLLFGWLVASSDTLGQQPMGLPYQGGQLNQSQPATTPPVVSQRVWSETDSKQIDRVGLESDPGMIDTFSPTTSSVMPSTRSSLGSGSSGSLANSIGPANSTSSLANGSLNPASRQIRVTVQKLWVDTETRESLYRLIGDTPIRRMVSSRDSQSALDPVGASAMISQQIISPARLSTCVLDDPIVNRILQRASNAPHSELSNAPSVMLIDGKAGQMNDTVQRRFVVDVKREGDQLIPSFQTIHEGTRIRIETTIAERPSGSMLVSTIDLQVDELRDVEVDRVYGLSDTEPVTVQRPIVAHTRVRIVQETFGGDTVWIDPHVHRTRHAESNSQIPLLGGLPLIGKRFRHVATETHAQHLIVLVRPQALK